MPDKPQTTPMTEMEVIKEITSAISQALVTVLAPDPMRAMMNEINFAFGRYNHEREEAKKLAEDKRYDL